MPRAATTTDVFNAIAEPRRREIIDVLVDGKEHGVGEMVKTLRISQPAVSKPGSAGKAGLRGLRSPRAAPQERRP